MKDYAIEAKGVKKYFGDIKALRNVDLFAEKNKVTALLGPNGAGKTTLIKVMTTLLTPEKGRVVVDGINLLEDPKEARRHIGLAGQFAAIDDYLTGRETLEMMGQLYHIPKQEVKKRAKDILKKLDLTDAADRQAKTYSGGMRRRLDLGASLVATPQVLFLDEPTTGLDPRTRLQLWDVIRELVANGTTILLTTQYLEEADALADKIFVMDKGKMIAEGTSESLKRGMGANVIEIKVEGDKLDEAYKLIKSAIKTKVELDELTNRIKISTITGSGDLLKVAHLLKEAKIKTDEMSLHRPSLDDVFLTITGDKDA